MGDWWERRWVRLHAMAAPVGILAATLLLTYWRQGWYWQWPDGLDRAADLVDIGTVIYAVIAVAVERGVNVIFWALEERKKRRERRLAEAQAERERLEAERERRRAEAQAERERLQAESRAQGEAEAVQRYESWLAKVAEEKGIPLADLLPPNGTRQGNPPWFRRP